MLPWEISGLREVGQSERDPPLPLRNYVVDAQGIIQGFSGLTGEVPGHLRLDRRPRQGYSAWHERAAIPSPAH